MTDRILFGSIFAFVFCLAGALFMRSGYRQLKTQKEKKQKCLSQTVGKIVHISSMSMRTRSGRGRRSYFPIYEYVVDNEVIRVEYKAGTTYCPYKVGEQVPVLYDKNDPRSSYIEGYKEDSAASVGGMIMGGIVVLCGLFVGVAVWFG